MLDVQLDFLLRHQTEHNNHHKIDKLDFSKLAKLKIKVQPHKSNSNIYSKLKLRQVVRMFKVFKMILKDSFFVNFKAFHSVVLN